MCKLYFSSKQWLFIAFRYLSIDPAMFHCLYLCPRKWNLINCINRITLQIINQLMTSSKGSLLEMGVSFCVIYYRGCRVLQFRQSHSVLFCIHAKNTLQNNPFHNDPGLTAPRSPRMACSAPPPWWCSSLSSTSALRPEVESRKIIQLPTEELKHIKVKQDWLSLE